MSEATRRQGRSARGDRRVPRQKQTRNYALIESYRSHPIEIGHWQATPLLEFARDLCVFKLDFYGVAMNVCAIVLERTQPPRVHPSCHDEFRHADGFRPIACRRGAAAIRTSYAYCTRWLPERLSPRAGCAQCLRSRRPNSVRNCRRSPGLYRRYWAGEEK